MRSTGPWRLPIDTAHPRICRVRRRRSRAHERAHQQGNGRGERARGGAPAGGTGCRLGWRYARGSGQSPPERVDARKTSAPASGTSATAGVSAMASLRLPHHGNCDRDRGSSRAGQDRGEGPSATLGRPAHSHAARPPPWVTRQARSIEAFDDVGMIVRDNAPRSSLRVSPAPTGARASSRAWRARGRDAALGRHESAGQTPAVGCPDRRPRRKRAYRARDAIIGARLVPLGSRRSSNGSEVNADRSRSDPT